MGDVDVDNDIQTCALVQLALEIIAEPDKKASQKMVKKLEPEIQIRS